MVQICKRMRWIRGFPRRGQWFDFLPSLESLMVSLPPTYLCHLPETAKNGSILDVRWPTSATVPRITNPQAGSSTLPRFSQLADYRNWIVVVGVLVSGFSAQVTPSAFSAKPKSNRYDAMPGPASGLEFQAGPDLRFASSQSGNTACTARSYMNPCDPLPVAESQPRPGYARHAKLQRLLNSVPFSVDHPIITFDTHLSTQLGRTEWMAFSGVFLCPLSGGAQQPPLRLARLFLPRLSQILLLFSIGIPGGLGWHNWLDLAGVLRLWTKAVLVLAFMRQRVTSDQWPYQAKPTVSRRNGRENFQQSYTRQNRESKKQCLVAESNRRSSHVTRYYSRTPLELQRIATSTTSQEAGAAERVAQRPFVPRAMSYSISLCRLFSVILVSFSSLVFDSSLRPANCSLDIDMLMMALASCSSSRDRVLFFQRAEATIKPISKGPDTPKSGIAYLSLTFFQLPESDGNETGSSRIFHVGHSGLVFEGSIQDYQIPGESIGCVGVYMSVRVRHVVATRGGGRRERDIGLLVANPVTNGSRRLTGLPQFSTGGVNSFWFLLDILTFHRLESQGKDKIQVDMVRPKGAIMRADWWLSQKGSDHRERIDMLLMELWMDRSVFCNIHTEKGSASVAIQRHIPSINTHFLSLLNRIFGLSSVDLVDLFHRRDKSMEHFLYQPSFNLAIPMHPSVVQILKRFKITDCTVA
ncbi:uncharacterized protein CLUP02_04884 [Colletotrichum lupini]|uniref:Uncharacterized protein n=1 Tax=Colletotrichum lupini TaxID=145971 RepID=A0A9Q8SM21_9PEZI|nr:uncharacterized protein CLUP02_04884 [Colletotrichum lupini]UQC79405.1 hypothetical protein CLUP02_04884 [Colletotrichum lupini]